MKRAICAVVFALVAACSAQRDESANERAGAPLAETPAGSEVRGGAAAPTEVEHPDWLAKDVERAKQVQAALARPRLTVEGLVGALAGCDVRSDRDLGFGARSVRLAAYGGYTTVWVTILAEQREGESPIASVVLSQSGAPDSFPTIASRLRAAWEIPVREVEHGFACERVDAAAVEALRERTSAALGGTPAHEPAGEQLAAFLELTQPEADLIVGTSFGIVGGPPPGASATAALVAAGRFDLLRAALRGLNPEGRVYAAHALRTKGRSEPADEGAIERLRALPLPLQLCSGCIVETADFDAALARLAQ